jgi:alpha-tubulin suppressor-like RCC1 family protein
MKLFFLVLKIPFNLEDGSLWIAGMSEYLTKNNNSFNWDKITFGSDLEPPLFKHAVAGENHLLAIASKDVFLIIKVNTFLEDGSMYSMGWNKFNQCGTQLHQMDNSCSDCSPLCSVNFGEKKVMQCSAGHGHSIILTGI